MLKLIRRDPCQSLKEAGAHIVVDDLGTGDQTSGLLRKRIRDLDAPVSDIGDAVSRHAVDVFAPPGVPQRSPATTHDNDRTFAIHTARVGVLQVYSRSHRRRHTLLPPASAWTGASMVVPAPFRTSCNEALPMQTRGTPPRRAS